MNLGGDNWRRGVGAHAARVGSGITFTDPLVVLTARHGQRNGTVGDHNKACLFAAEKLLDNDAAARIAKGIPR